MLIEAGNLAVVTVGGNLFLWCESPPFLSQFVTQYFFNICHNTLCIYVAISTVTDAEGFL